MTQIEEWLAAEERSIRWLARQIPSDEHQPDNGHVSNVAVRQWVKGLAPTPELRRQQIAFVIDCAPDEIFTHDGFAL